MNNIDCTGKAITNTGISLIYEDVPMIFKEISMWRKLNALKVVDNPFNYVFNYAKN